MLSQIQTAAFVAFCKRSSVFVAIVIFPYWDSLVIALSPPGPFQLLGK
jgi:hypothetical protein